jgi:hypothetical protein
MGMIQRFTGLNLRELFERTPKPSKESPTIHPRWAPTLAELIAHPDAVSAEAPCTHKRAQIGTIATAHIAEGKYTEFLTLANLLKKSSWADEITLDHFTTLQERLVENHSSIFAAGSNAHLYATAHREFCRCMAGALQIASENDTWRTAFEGDEPAQRITGAFNTALSAKRNDAPALSLDQLMVPFVHLVETCDKHGYEEMGDTLKDVSWRHGLYGAHKGSKEGSVSIIDFKGRAGDGRGVHFYRPLPLLQKLLGGRAHPRQGS